MVVLNIETSACTPQTIVIGRRGTYDTTQIAFDLTYLVESYGSGVAVIAVKRSQDESAYPAVATQDGNTLTWTVSETDTAYVGAGECQLMWYVDGGLAKTIIYPMVVMRDILSTAEEAPDAYQTWADDLTALGAETLQNAQNAAQSASDAEDAKDDAVTAKEGAEAAQKAAETAVTHYPKIENNYWMVWDSTSKSYVSTGIQAEGEDGYSPEITITSITGGHRVIITDKDHPQGQSFDVMDGQGGGTSNYADLSNKPKINNVELNGNKTAHDLGLAAQSDIPTVPVQSVNGKTGAVNLASGDIAYDESATYQAGSVGAELQEQNRQLSDTESALDEITIPNVVTETIDIMQIATPMIDVGGYAVTATRGGYANNNGTTSCIWDITDETTFYFGTSTAPYVACVIIENPTREWKTQGGYTAVMDGDSAVRYRKSDNNLPSQSNPYTTNNAVVILTITTAETAPITVTTQNGIVLDLLQTTGYDKTKAMSQDAVTKAVGAIKKSAIIKYGSVDTDVGSRGKEQITIFSPTDDGFIKFAIVRCEYENYNANNWRIDKCYACDNDLNVLFPITYDGEWEMAIQIVGAPDFIGGNAHGDEVLTEFHVLINGIEVGDITEIVEQECREIRIVETTLLYNPSDGATLSTRTDFTPVGTHGREYIFDSNSLRLKQVVTLSTALNLGASYMTMFPILRGNDTVSALQVTNAYVADNDYTEYDVSVGASGSAGYGWKRNVTMATIWGDDSGVSATVEMLKQPDIENSGARQFQVQNTVNAYNKLYWSICGVGGSNYAASANERFETDTIYKINHKNVS